MARPLIMLGDPKGRIADIRQEVELASARAANSDKMVLCIDEDFEGVNELGSWRAAVPVGRRAVCPEQPLDDAMKFLGALKRNSDQTVKFGEALLAAGILAPAKVGAAGREGKTTAISGARVADRRKLKALPPDATMDLVRRDYLELIYLHLASLDLKEPGGCCSDEPNAARRLSRWSYSEPC